jgi:hypothetical protein
MAGWSREHAVRVCPFLSPRIRSPMCIRLFEFLMHLSLCFGHSPSFGHFMWGAEGKRPNRNSRAIFELGTTASLQSSRFPTTMLLTSLSGGVLGQMDAFFSSLMMILVSELGDKTFFIAAVMAMKHSRGVVLAGLQHKPYCSTNLTRFGRELKNLLIGSFGEGKLSWVN